MQLKITTDYALRTVLYLAGQGERVVSSGEIAGAMSIPQKYLIQIAASLKEAGILLIFTGRNGGYRLAKPPEELTLAEIVNVTEDTTRLNRCLEADNCCSRSAAASCPVRRYYAVIQSLWDLFLQEMTVSDLMADPDEKTLRKKLFSLMETDLLIVKAACISGGKSECAEGLRS